ncbi:hybrid sensor histidine kinase/response regulator [Opitutus terrae]|uniref:histidine kinase n=1 Tax=Opitutus terrae (strain DSM 11246 / JCM 15787 / PB90-1) TaxID=452637 RepID=B1ZWU4_OPITP|nr:PAS domain S-box protein [Opitutus terrae]ACB74221.1 multi-sensor hybrid histidine kinase [Opitutus terrae PB90-1]
MRVLHLEDSTPDAELVAARLTQDWPECQIQRAASRQQFESALDTGDFDLILSDYTLHGYDGLSALDLARTHCPEKPFIFLSGTIGEERAIEALKRGATDYVIKDRPSRLVPAMRQALARSQEEQRLRRTEEALRQNRERFRQIAENVADLIVMLDSSAHCLYANPAYATAVGRPHDCTGRDVFADVHPDDRAAVEKLFRATLHQGRNGRAEYRLAHADGTVRYVEAQASAVRDFSGTITQVLIVARDVTEQRAARERIRQQAALLDHAQDAILVRDMEDRVTYWNRSAARIYGWADEEPRQRRAADLWMEEPGQVEIARNATLFYGEWMGEMRQRSREEVDLIMQSRWSLLQRPDGSAAGFLVINTDIAEKKRLEAQFLRVQRTESIGLLAGGVAHDINNVLLPIMASTELLEPMATSPETKQFLASIRSSAQHGAALVRQLLAFARGAVGQHTDVMLRPLLEDFVGFVNQTFPRSISVSLAPGEAPWAVRGDATQLKQVLMNLCINARDAMPEGGRITLHVTNTLVNEVEAARLREIKPGPHVVIEVADTGSGMSPAVLERIFDPFFTTKEVGKGTGLGLAAVRGIVKGHNGTIAVESWPGRGTNFKIYLPALTGAVKPAAAAPDARTRPGAGETFLLVDDDDSVRNVLSTVLTASGYRVLKASSAAEAERVFSAHHAEIQLVLTDVMMADGDGFSVVRRLRQLGAQVPMLIMSGLAGAGNYEHQAAALKVPLLAKPLTREALLRAVQTALTGKPKSEG